MTETTNKWFNQKERIKGLSIEEIEKKNVYTEIFIHWGVEMQSSLNSFQ